MARPRGIVLDGELICAERERQGITRAELAEHTREIARAKEKECGHKPTDPGLTGRTISNAEKGRPASKRTAQLIAQALGIPYLFLVRRDADAIADHLRREGVNAEPAPVESIDRGEQCDTLARNLLSQQRRACIFGATGSGKTAIARQLVERDDVRARYVHGVVWLDNSPALVQRRYWVVMAQIARALGFFRQLPAREDHNIETIRKRFHDCLSKGVVLLVFDNLSDAHAVRWLVPRSGRVGALVTTRHRAVAKELDDRYQTLTDLSRGEASTQLRRGEIDRRNNVHDVATELLARTPDIANSMQRASMALRNGDATIFCRYVHNSGRELSPIRSRYGRSAAARSMRSASNATEDGKLKVSYLGGQ